jgi:hypothetical protein
VIKAAESAASIEANNPEGLYMFMKIGFDPAMPSNGYKVARAYFGFFTDYRERRS